MLTLSVAVPAATGMLAGVSGPLLASLGLACAALAARLVGWLPANGEQRWIHWLQALAVGLLLGDALMHMLPAGMAHGVSATLMGKCLAIGVAALLLIESLVRSSSSDRSVQPLGSMTIVGDTVHHFVDGAVIGASFALGAPIGVIVTLAIIGHELPREASNAAVLVAAGYSPSQAFRWSVLTTAAIPMGAMSTFVLGKASAWTGISLTLAAGATLYLALGDILPALWVRLHGRHRFVPVIGVVVGLLFMWWATRWE